MYLQEMLLELILPKESMVKAGDKVKVYVSKGAEVVQTAVPYLIGETSEKAKHS